MAGPFAPIPLEGAPPRRASEPSDREDRPPGPLTFKALYDDHFRFVWRTLRRLGVPESDITDAVQDVFLVVHRRLPDFEGRSKVTTWLYGISFHVARDRRRMAASRRWVDVPEGAEDPVDEGADVAAIVEHNQGMRLLEAILDEMPLDQRAVFTLFELDGLAGDAIAELLDIPLGTVHSRLRLGREQFRRTLTRVQARSRFPRALAGGAR